MRFAGPDWDNFATEESKKGMTLWVLGGLVYQWYVGHLLSWPTLLLLFPGIFVASLAAIPTALLNRMKVRQLSAMKAGARPRSTLILLAWTIWYVFDLAYPMLLAIIALRLMQG